MYGYNKERFSADGFYAIPTDQLAYAHYIAAYDQANIATQFAISATADTNVQITLPAMGKIVYFNPLWEKKLWIAFTTKIYSHNVTNLIRYFLKELF